MRERILIDRDWLFYQYIIMKYTLMEISDMIGCSWITIRRNLQKYDIPCRTNSESHKGLKCSEETKRKISEGNKGKIISEETRRRTSKAMMGNHHNLGSKRTDEARRNMSASQQGISIDEWEDFALYDSYGDEFNNRLREQIRERDSYVCQECGIAQDQLDRRLAVHHIDYDKTNNDPNNLISLCQSCHSKTNFNRKDWIDYFQNKNVRIEKEILL